MHHGITYNTQVTEAQYQSEFLLTKRTSYLIHMGELLSVVIRYFGEIVYKCTTLHLSINSGVDNYSRKLRTQTKKRDSKKCELACDRYGCHW